MYIKKKRKEKKPIYIYKAYLEYQTTTVRYNNVAESGPRSEAGSIKYPMPMVKFRCLRAPEKPTRPDTRYTVHLVPFNHCVWPPQQYNNSIYKDHTSSVFAAIIQKPFKLPLIHSRTMTSNYCIIAFSKLPPFIFPNKPLPYMGRLFGFK